MEFGVEKYTYGIMYKTHMCMCIILMLSWICIYISHDKYFIFVLFEIVVSRVLVKWNRLSCPVLSVSRVVVSVIKFRLLCFVGDDGRVLVVCSLGRWLRLMGIVFWKPPVPGCPLVLQGPDRARHWRIPRSKPHPIGAREGEVV